MLIRAATTADRDAIAALHAASWQDAYTAELPAELLRDAVPGLLRGTWDARTFAPPELTMVAEADGALAGFVCALTDRDPPLIDNLHVRPGGRGSGTGTRLMDAIRAALAAEGFRRAHLTVLESNPRALAFYLARGGADEGTVTERMVGRAVRARRIVFALP